MEPGPAVGIGALVVVAGLGYYLYVYQVRPAQAAGPTGMHWFHNDHLNRPMAMTDTSKTVEWRGLLEPYGPLWDSTGSITFGNNPSTDLVWEPPFRFPGQWVEEHTSERSFQNWHRMYHYTHIDYNRADPLAVQNVFLGHPYVYAEDAPLVLIDFEGLSPTDCVPGPWFPIPHSLLDTKKVKHSAYALLDTHGQGQLVCICHYIKEERIYFTEIYKTGRRRVLECCKNGNRTFIPEVESGTELKQWSEPVPIIGTRNKHFWPGLVTKIGTPTAAKSIKTPSGCACRSP